MPTSLSDWLWGDPYKAMMDDARQDNDAKYGTNRDQPPLRSVDDPTPYKAFHDDHGAAFTDGPAAYGPPGGNTPLASQPPLSASRRR